MAMRKTPMISAVDVFCGAAGLSLGLKQAGIEVRAGIDLDPACQYPFEKNIGSAFLKRDIADVAGSEIEGLFEAGSVRVLAGCAPCQPFSGYTTKRREIDPRWQLLLEFGRVVAEAKPEIVTMENVPRLSHLPLWQSFVADLVSVGYHVSWSVLDAADFSVPQHRRRLVLLASRLGPIALPEPKKTRKTVESVIGGLPRVAAGKKNPADPLHASRALTDRNLARIRQSVPAGTWRDWPKKMQVACHKAKTGKTYPSVYGRMSWDKPSPTITTQFYGFGNGRFGHPTQDRAITLREGAILQSFPKDFQFAPPEAKLNFRGIGRLIGNAVPPALAKSIGEAIVHHVTSTAPRSA